MSGHSTARLYIAQMHWNVWIPSCHFFPMATCGIERHINVQKNQRVFLFVHKNGNHNSSDKSTLSATGSLRCPGRVEQAVPWEDCVCVCVSVTSALAPPERQPPPPPSSLERFFWAKRVKPNHSEQSHQTRSASTCFHFAPREKQTAPTTFCWLSQLSLIVSSLVGARLWRGCKSFIYLFFSARRRWKSAADFKLQQISRLATTQNNVLQKCQ